MKYSLAFRPLTANDFVLLSKWLAEPHVSNWWRESPELYSIEKKYLPRIEGKEPTRVFIIETFHRAIGWVQWYRWRDYLSHAAKLGAESADAGLDLAIGEKDLLGKGIGSQGIRDFLEQIVFCDSEIKACVCDPEELNLRSLRAFERAGFISVRTVKLEGEDVLRRVVRLENL